MADDDSATTQEDEPVTVPVKNNDEAGPANEDGQSLTVTRITTAPEDGTATINDNGTITYEPDPNFNGRDTFTYEVCDDGDPQRCDTATVTVEVGAANDPPVARNDTGTTAENEPVRIPVLSNDSDPDNDPLTVQSFTQPDNGRVSRSSDGSLTYTPNRGFSGQNSFTYTASDGNGGTDTATVTITVRPAPAPTPPPNRPSPPGPTPPPPSDPPRGGICDGVGNANKNIFGTPGNDVLVGTNGENTIIGFGGNDRIYGCGGNDSIIGNDGRNRIFGGSGNDSINGGRNNDLIVGGSGRDAINGSGGRDRLYARDGSRDTANGGSGRDVCRTDNRDRKVSCP